MARPKSPGAPMRTLLILVLVAALAWSGWWVIGSRAKEAAIDAALAASDANGLEVEHGEIAVQGYPNRFDTVIPDIRLADPRRGWTWEAPSLEILALSYAPNHVIAVWPPNQTLTTPMGRFDIASERLRASLRLSPTPSLPLAEARVEALELNVRGPGDAITTLGTGFLAMRKAPEATGNDYQLSLEGSTLGLPENLHDLLDQAGLPSVVGSLDIRLLPSFDRPIDRHAAEGDPSALTALAIDRARLSWGEMELTIDGALTADPEGFAQGAVALNVRNWQSLTALLTATEALPPTAIRALESGLERAQVDDGTVRLPLTLEGGRVKLGFIPLMAAPRLNDGGA